MVGIKNKIKNHHELSLKSSRTFSDRHAKIIFMTNYTILSKVWKKNI